MSQQMESEEFDRGYAGSREGGPGYQQYQYGGMGGQKIGPYPVGGGATAGQRLALAIVSLCLLVPLLGITAGIVTSLEGPGVLVGLLALALVCLTIMVVNIVFNIRH